MAVDLQSLARILEASLDPTQNKQGLTLILQLAVFFKLTCMCSGACYPTRREEAQLFPIVAANCSHSDIRLYCSSSRRLVLQELHQKALDSEHLLQYKSGTHVADVVIRTKMAITSYLRMRLRPSSVSLLGS